MDPVLVVDCYVEGDGAANYRRLLGNTPVVVWRALFEVAPERLGGFSGVMISGSAACITHPEPWMAKLTALIIEARAADVPILGVCFGHQMVAHALFGEGTVQVSKTPEIGWTDICVTGDDSLLAGLGAGFNTFESHFDEVVAQPGMTVLAHSERCAVQAYRVDGARIWGVQFHSEMTEEEAVALAKRRIEGRPDLGLDVDETIAEAKDSTSIGQRIMRNFLEAP
jgi:GMP synthase (glutamine-hydrolysing)